MTTFTSSTANNTNKHSMMHIIEACTHKSK